MDPEDFIPLIDTDEVKKCRLIDVNNFRINGRRFLMVYTEPKFSEKRARIHMSDVYKKGPIDTRIFTEVHPTEGMRMYVLVDFQKVFQTTVHRLFEIRQNRPIVYAIRCKTDWCNVLSCYPESDAIPEQVSEEERPSPPPPGLSDMKYWQEDVVELMKANVSAMKPAIVKGRQTKDCKINIVVTRDRCGRSTLVSTLKRAKPISVHIVEGIADMEELAALRRMPPEEWNRETLIVNIGHTSDIEGLRAVYVFIDSLMTKTCRDVWFFSSQSPVVTADENGKVVAYGVDQADWENGKVGRLIPRRLPRPGRS